ncbi:MULTISPECIES: phosphate ABC transporter permease subunit PstC [Actinoallomurus]|uniref:phosphate ABC transporter permease subunit PstC n=1 Tax=Actinoallomurus TaxID=667113 RepID=UPI00209316AE|nr:MULTISPECIES: phosphate ABC transporter permease subunit PstC [Actinoallomurus]MCO5968830.1 phosphate ABC transporter permease subunit PstC [Actinoallomurus soli]MCO5996168.1 phosphate ABC transporter permease subunit PstC [Actinoallomurus rhizosphaericola]
MTSETLEQGATRALGGRARKMSTGRTGDRLFGLSAKGSGILLLAVMAAIAVFLIVKALPALRADKANFLTSQEWNPDAAQSRFGIAQLTFGTVLSSLLALILATPVAVGIALFIGFYAPRRLADGLGYVVDLLAAVPSIVYGLWGLQFFVPKMNGVATFLHDDFGWIPLFGGDTVGGQCILTASIVLAIMILPIISSITREVFLQVPRANVEAALALGATRWEVIRMAVLPFGRSGMISASMLGLGRALGETIAVALVLGTASGISLHLLKPGGNTFAANIANTFAMAGKIGQSALIASGLVLFVITLLVNMAARAVIARRKEFV